MTKDCYFCKGVQKTIHFLDAETLSTFMGFNARILPARRTKCCPKHQRHLARAVKRARQFGLLAFVRR